MAFLDRSRKAGRYLEWKVRLFFLGALLAAVGVMLDRRWIVLLAIGVLIAGAALRFLPGAHPPEEEVAVEDESD